MSAEEPERCPKCRRKLRVFKSKRISYRLVHSGRTPTKRQTVEITVVLKRCACGFTDHDESENILGEVEI